jgi:hypothetical protein
LNTIIHPYYLDLIIPVKEIWKFVPETNDKYKASTWGRVKSLDMLVFNGKVWYPKSGRILKATVDVGRVLIGLGGKNGKLRPLSHVILRTFVGPKPDGMEACHWDGNPKNNRLENLRWDTHKNNEADKIRHGTNNECGRNGSAKITKIQARNVRELYMTGKYSYEGIEKETGINKGIIHTLVTGKCWNHPDCYPDGYVIPKKRTPKECFQGVNRWSGEGCKEIR